MAIRVEIHPLAGVTWEELDPLWTKLLVQARNESPFLDWQWLKLWWSHFSPAPGESAHMCVAYDEGEPIGALPVVVGPVRRTPGIRLMSVQTLGSRLFDSRSVFSEYLGVVGPLDRQNEACLAIVQSLYAQFRPGEFVVGWTKQRHLWADALSARPGAYLRLASCERSYQADLREGFSAYVGGLGASTRRSLLHLRARLERLGTVEVVQSGDVQGAWRVLDELNRLHAGRWGTPAFSGHALSFHRELIANWLPEGRVAMSRLLLNGQCLSCLYDLRIGTTQYNIQLGFDSAFRGRVSLGLIHLGYAIEQAASELVDTYDFLAGRGRRSNYKSNLASRSQEVATIQALSGSATTALYRLVDLIRGGHSA